MLGEEVRPDELTVDRMGVAVGTPVIDQITGLEYRYGEQGKFGDPKHELPVDFMAGGNSGKAAPGQGGRQQGDAGEQPTNVKSRGGDSHTHQPKGPFTSMLYAIGLGLFAAILLSGYFVIRRLRRARQ